MESAGDWPDFIRGLPEVELPFAGARGWMIQGVDHQVVFVEFTERVEVPEHSHAEQWEFALDGKATLRRGGESVDYVTGDRFFIAAGVPHGATVHAGYKAMIVFNAPDRYTARA